jgi:Ca2+-binding EF-hand superfamily protein
MDVMKTLGQNPTADEIKQMIHEIDEDGDGNVDFDEFLLLMVKQEKAAEGEEEELVTVFK